MLPYHCCLVGNTQQGHKCALQLGLLKLQVPGIYCNFRQPSGDRQEMLTAWLPLQEPDNEVYKKALVMTEKVCSSLLTLGWRC